MLSSSKKNSIGEGFYKTTTFIYKWLCIIGSVSVVLLCSAIFLFFMYYQYTMPNIFSIAQPLYFDYQTPSHQIVEPNTNVNIHYHIEKTDYLPSNLNNGFSKPTLPTANFIIPPDILDKRAAYSFTIRFQFADSTINRQIGMFMVRMNLKNKEGSILSTASRPTIIPQRSTINRIARDLILLIPTLLGLYEEMYVITIPCIHYFRDISSDPLHSIQVSLSHSDIQLFSSTLYIGTELFGIPYAFHHYFVATSILFIVIFFFTQWGILLCSISLYYLRSYMNDNSTKNPNNHNIAFNRVNNNNNDIDDILIERKVSTKKANKLAKNYEKVNNSPFSSTARNLSNDNGVVLIHKRNESVGIGDEEHSSEGKSIVDSEIEELEEAITSPRPVVPPIPLDEDTLIEEAPKKLRKRPPYANRPPATVVDINSLPIDSPNPRK